MGALPRPVLIITFVPQPRLTAVCMPHPLARFFRTRVYLTRRFRGAAAYVLAQQQRTTYAYSTAANYGLAPFSRVDPDHARADRPGRRPV